MVWGYGNLKEMLKIDSDFFGPKTLGTTTVVELITILQYTIKLCNYKYNFTSN